MIQSFFNLVQKQRKEQQTAQRLLNARKIPVVSEMNALVEKAESAPPPKTPEPEKKEPIIAPKVYPQEIGNNANALEPTQVKFPDTELKAGGDIKQDRINFYRKEIEDAKEDLDNQGLWELIKSYPRKLIGGTDYERLAIAQNKLDQFEQGEKVGINASFAQGLTNKTAIPVVGDIVQAGRNMIKRNAFRKQRDGQDLDSIENILLLEDEIDNITPKSTGYQVSEGLQHTLRFIGDLLLARRLGKIPESPVPIHSIKDMTVANTLKNTAHYLKHSPKLATLTPFTYTEISNRLAPHYKQIAGKTFQQEGKGYYEAIVTGYVSSVATIATEGLGELFNPAFKLASPLKKYLSPKFIREWLENIPTSKTTEVIKKIREGASIQGFIPEMAEEVLDGFIQSYINNDPQNRFMSKEEFKNTAYVIGLLRALGLSGQIKDIVTEGANEVGGVINDAYTDFRQGEGLFLEGEMDKIMGGDKEVGEGNTQVFTGEDIAKEAEEMGSDQGGINNFLADKIKSENYTTQEIPIEEIRKNDPDLDEYLKNSEVREYEGEPFQMNPIISSSGEVLDGYNRIAQRIANGETTVEVLKGIDKKTEAKTSPLQDDIDRSKLINLPEGKKSVSTSPAEIQQTDIQGGETTLAQLQEQKRREEERAELQKLQSEKSGKIQGDYPTYQADLFNGKETDQNLFTQQANREIRGDIQKVEDKLDKLIQTRATLSQKLYEVKENYNPFDSNPEQESVIQRLEERIQEVSKQIRQERNGGDYIERYSDEANEMIRSAGIQDAKNLLDNDEIEEKINDLRKKGIPTEDIFSMYSQQDEQNIEEYINDLHEYYYEVDKEKDQEVSQNEMPQVKGLVQGLADWVEYNKLFLSKALGIGKTAPKKEEIYDFFSSKDWASFLKIANEKKRKTKLTNDFLERFGRLDSAVSEASTEDGVDISADEAWDMMIVELNSGDASKRVSAERRRLAQKTKKARQTTKKEKGELNQTKPEEVNKTAEVELLPSDVSLEDEAQEVGAKRIAPDRVSHHQLTPQESIDKMYEEQKTEIETALQFMQDVIGGKKRMVKASKKVREDFERIKKNVEAGTATDYQKRWYDRTASQWGNIEKTDLVYKHTEKKSYPSQKVQQLKDKQKELTKESVQKEYVDLIKKDISKGYRFPQAVINFDRSFTKAVDNRERYEKGLRTSFGVDDERIIFEDRDIIGAGMKRQDGNELTQDQKDEIKNGVVDFSNALKLDMKKLADKERWVYVHLNNKNPFLTKGASGLYRKDYKRDGISISVGGTESYTKKVDGKMETIKVNTTMAHELGHALDYQTGKTLIPKSVINKLKYTFNPVLGDKKYYRKDVEIVARMIEQYVAVSKGHDSIYNQPAQWTENIYEEIIKPEVEKAIDTHFSEYRTKGEVKLPERKTAPKQEKGQISQVDRQAKKKVKKEKGVIKKTNNTESETEKAIKTLKEQMGDSFDFVEPMGDLWNSERNTVFIKPKRDSIGYLNALREKNFILSADEAGNGIYRVEVKQKVQQNGKGQLQVDTPLKPSKIKSDDNNDTRQNAPTKDSKGEIIPQGSRRDEKKQSSQIVAKKTRRNKGQISQVDRQAKKKVNTLAKNQTLEVEEKTFEMKEVRLLKERIRNFARGVRAGRSDVKKELSEVKKEIAKFARDSLPTTEFRKSETTYLLSRVAEAKNEKDIRKAFERILKIAEDSKKRVLTSKITKELKNTKVKKKNGIPQGKFTPETQEALDKMKTIVAMSKEDAQDKIVQNVSAMDTETDLNMDELIMENELLNYADIKNMKSEELAETLNFIKFLKASGRHEKKQKIEARKKRLETIREGVSESITGGKEAPKVAIGTNEYEKKPLRDTLRGWDDASQGWVTLLDKLSRFDKSSKPFQSKLSVFGENIFHARNGKNMMIMDLQAKVQQKGKDLFGTHRKLRKALNNSFEEKEIGTFKDESGEEVLLKMSEQQALDFYLMSKDAENMAKIMEDNQYTQEMIDAIEDSITPKMLEYGQFMQSLTSEIKEKVAPIYEDLYGIKFPNNPDYWPRTVDFESMKKDSLMLLEEQSKTSTDPSAVKTRTKHKRPLKFENATMKFMRHIDQMSHFVNFAKPIKDIRSVFGNEEIRKSIKAFHGKTAMREVDDMINDLAVDRATQGKTYKMLDEFRKRFTTASTGLNLNVFVKQLTSFPAYAGDVPLKDFSEEALGFWTNPVKNFKTLMDSSDLMKARYTMGFERDLRDAMQTTAIQKATNGKSLVDLAMFLVKNGDKFAIVNGGWAKYRYEYKKNLRQGKTKEQAHKRAIQEFEKATKLSQQASDIEDLGNLQRSGSLGKLFTMFQTSPIAYYRQTGVALRAFLNKRGFTAMSEAEAEAFRAITLGENIEENVQILERELAKGRKEISTGQKISTQTEYAKRFLIYWVVLPSVFQYVSDGFEWEEENQARAMILGAFNFIPAFGNAIQTISGKIVGDRWDWDPIPMVSVINSIGDLFRKVPDIKKHLAGEEVMKGSSINSAVNDFLSIGGTATGFPLKPAYTTLSGAKELYTGETGDFRRLIQSEYSIFDGKTEAQTIQKKAYIQKLSKDEASRWLDEQERLRDRGEISVKTFNSRVKKMSELQREAPILKKYADRAEKILQSSPEQRRAVYEAMREKEGFIKQQFVEAGLEKLFNEFYQ